MDEKKKALEKQGTKQLLVSKNLCLILLFWIIAILKAVEGTILYVILCAIGDL